MKHTKNILGTMLLTAAAVAVTSCVDDSKLLFAFEKPASIAGMEYLNEYDALKTYVNSSANPDFKLGIALTADDYIAGGLVTRLANSNFQEMTAGNAMKYASCVADDGTMDFGKVKNFVAAAKAGGLTIYGHTLAWHAQQNNKYLNSIIADKIIPGSGGPTLDASVITNSNFETDTSGWNGWGNNSTRERTTVGGGFGGTYGFAFTNPSEANPWEAQTVYGFASPLEVGSTYVLNFKVKGSQNGAISAALQNPEGYKGCGDFPTIEITGSWKEQTLEVVVTGENALRFLFNHGKYVGTIWIDDITLCRKNPNGSASVITKDYVTRSDFEDGIALMGWGNNSTRNVVDNKGYNGTKGLEIVNPLAVNFWEAQAGFDFANPLIEGETYFLNLKIKGSIAGSIRSGFQKPEGYAGRGDFPSISITTDWKEINVQTKVIGDAATRFLFSLGDYGGTIWMDDISIYREKKGNTIPLTPAEKKDTLTWAMNNWINGMMKATGGYVTAWDVVNEAIAGGGDDGEGFYPLQSATNVSADDAKNNFYWQDYLGSEDYVRIAVASARKYYAENGGTNPLRLFVNDYNLESDWDDNKKVKSLVHWIEKWEADGVTKIDGIGTQMHVSCHANAETQKSKEDHVVKMFEILAESGKLVKITELDMGYVDEEGNSVKTADMTEAQHKAMSEYYKFIVKKYFEIIPAAQQYGITQWCITDSPTGSGWRGGEPVGLWDANYNRKHTYAGFADGLSGR